MTDHPPHDELSSYVEGTLTDESRQRVDQHLTYCRACTLRYQELADEHYRRTHPRVAAPAPRRPWPLLLGAAAFMAVLAAWWASCRIG